MTNSSNVVSSLRQEIQTRKSLHPEGSIERATLWFDSVSEIMDALFNYQQSLGNKARLQISNTNSSLDIRTIVSSFLLVFVLCLCPYIIRSVVHLMKDMQRYALTLADKTKELNREKRRTDSLLYQMLPKPVAEQLKRTSNVNAEYFKDVTVFFSDVVAFTTIASSCTPMEIVDLLNSLYNVFDARIELYDVYKVETIGESYMVASGMRMFEHSYIRTY